MTSPQTYRLTDFLPTTKKELELRGWNEVDVVLFSGDAYVDHPSFGAAVIGRLLEAQGLKVALVPQPDWRSDHRDFTKMGRPRLFFGVTAGNMDSMVNHYTAGKRLRSDDAFTADGKAGARPDYATITYCKILKQLYPDIPIVVGGIEASLRRLTHYDYWSDKLMPSILVDSGADLLVYGMGEKPLIELCARLSDGQSFNEIHDIPQTAYLQAIDMDFVSGAIRLHSHEECLHSKHKQAENFRHIEEESNKLMANTLIQQVGSMEIVVNPPFPPLTTEELDRSYEYPYTRLPHPKYKGKTIPAYEMIKFSVNIHRGCFGGCAFCTISAHQGKFVMNRSVDSVLREVKLLIDREDFKGYLSDLGGPSANMYRMEGRDLALCRVCKRPSCIHPRVCPNLNTDHKPLIDLYRAVDALPGIKKSFIGSGIRYDLLTHSAADALTKKYSGKTEHKAEHKADAKANAKVLQEARQIDESSRAYLREVIENHVSGRLKVAPEHTSDAVLEIMRKPSFEQFKTFNKDFEALEEQRLRSAGTKDSGQPTRSSAYKDDGQSYSQDSRQDQARKPGRQQLIPYFISSHPGCTERDMSDLAAETRKLNFKLEQIQDFTPTPMTLATEIYYTGLHPYTLKPVFTARTKAEKEKQRSYFFWYKK
jgi:uncharacterized radical SAM protein YgiQ